MFKGENTCRVLQVDARPNEIIRQPTNRIVGHSQGVRARFIISPDTEVRVSGHSRYPIWGSLSTLAYPLQHLMTLWERPLRVSDTTHVTYHTPHDPPSPLPRPQNENPPKRIASDTFCSGVLDELGIEPRTFRILRDAKRTLYQLSHTPSLVVYRPQRTRQERARDRFLRFANKDRSDSRTSRSVARVEGYQGQEQTNPNEVFVACTVGGLMICRLPPCSLRG